jgi:hypothetical protein
MRDAGRQIDRHDRHAGSHHQKNYETTGNETTSQNPIHAQDSSFHGSATEARATCSGSQKVF